MAEPKIKKGDLITPSLFKRFFYDYAADQGADAPDITPFPASRDYYTWKTSDGRTVLSRYPSEADEPQGVVAPKPIMQAMTIDEFCGAFMLAAVFGLCFAGFIIENTPMVLVTAARYFRLYVFGWSGAMLLSVLFFKLRNKEFPDGEKQEAPRPQGPSSSTPSEQPPSEAGGVSGPA